MVKNMCFLLRSSLVNYSYFIRLCKLFIFIMIFLLGSVFTDYMINLYGKNSW
jgi:hypothetical protein